MPKKGGDIRKLKEFINFNNQKTGILLSAWLIGALNPSGSYTILILNGEQGTAKSTAARILRSLIDPSVAPLRKLPGNEIDLMIAAEHQWVLSFDNLSGLKQMMSNSLCSLSTGVGLSKRMNYSDRDEVIFESARPIILNGINEITNRGDLIDRSIIVQFEPIPEDQRKLESDLWEEFEQARPGILGAVLDAVSSALKNKDKVDKKSLPRMADFARWVMAAEPSLPWSDGLFIDTYNENRKIAKKADVEADLVATAIINFLKEEQNPWSGTTTELKDRLEEVQANSTFIYNKSWPKNVSYFSNRLTKVAPALRSEGINASRKTIKGSKKWQVEYI
ncbi:MAG: hypothetical protein JRH18_21720 [Deltaproteobacteria bacterium]|nr:hypothetical protein [Deltaproteobacteria bacterium]